MSEPGYSKSKVFHSSYCNGNWKVIAPDGSVMDIKETSEVQKNDQQRLIHPNGTKSDNNILKSTKNGTIKIKPNDYKENVYEANNNNQHGMGRTSALSNSSSGKSSDIRGYDSDDSALYFNQQWNSPGYGDRGHVEAMDRRRWAPRWINNNGPIRNIIRRPRPIAPDRYLAAAYPFRAKFPPTTLLNGSKYDPLSQEMWDLFVNTQQTEETFRKKMNLWRFLYVSIKSIFPRYGLYLVGSTLSGFGLDNSDVDLCLNVRALDCMDPRAHAVLHLGFILSYLRTFDPMLVNAELIQAKVPILKFRDSQHGIEVDLNCNNIVGIRNTNLLYCYSQCTAFCDYIS